MPTIETYKRYSRDYSYTITNKFGYYSVKRGSYTVTGLDQVIRQANLPNWQALIKAGLDATTSYTGNKLTIPKRRSMIMLVDEFGYLNRTQYRYTGYPAPYGVSVPSALPSTSALAKAEVDFAKQFRNKTRHWQGGVFLAELVETANLLRNPVKEMYSLTRYLAENVRRAHLGLLRHSKKDQARQYAKLLSNAWLVYSFGMKPLVSDANDAGKALRALASGRQFDIIKIRGVGESEEDRGFQSVPCAPPGFPGYFARDLNEVRRSSVVIRGAWKNSNYGGELPVPMQFGTSVLDIVPTVWEAIPWSFLVDYFANVGDTLDAYMLRFVDFAWINQTVRNSRTFTYSDAKYLGSGDSGITGSCSGGSTRTVNSYVSRAKRGNDFGGSLVFNVPGIQSMKWLNIAALSSKILKSKPPRFGYP